MRSMRWLGLGLAGCFLLAGSVFAGGCGGKGGGASEVTVKVGTDWVRTADESGLFSSPGDNVYITDVCAGGPGLVAVGYGTTIYQLQDGKFHNSLIVWTSPDGRDWTRLGQDAFTGGASQEMSNDYPRENWSEPRIVSGPAGLMVTCGLHIFRSRDGLSWSEVEGVAAFENSLCEMNSATGRFTFTYIANHFVDVAVSGNGYVASVVASSTRPGLQGWLPGPSIWTSPDGENWSLAQLEYVDIFGMDEINALAPGGPRLVAVGGGAGYLRAWTGTPDALAWTRSPDSPGLSTRNNDAFRGLAPGGPGLVAVSTSSFWSSPDGVTWNLSASNETAADAGLNAVSAGPLAAVGIVNVAESIPDKPLVRYTKAAVFNSPDGVAWTRVLLPRAGQDSKSSETAKSVASFTGGLVVVGHEEAGEQPVRGVIWTSLGY